jgi:quercetin dioxygenase-like cupin family protein
MILPYSSMDWISRQGIRGGAGSGRAADYLGRGDMDGILACGRTELQPGASVGEHAHPDTEEFYLVLEGRGTGILDGARFPVQAGDAFVVKAGHTHGMVNDSPDLLSFLGVLTQARDRA